MAVIAVITAMESEHKAVEKLYDFVAVEGGRQAEAYGHKVLLIKSGIGKVNGALAAQFAYASGAEVVITTGLAGGIDKSLQQGDIVLAEKVCYHDVWCGEPNAVGQVQDLPLYFEADKTMLQAIRQTKEGQAFKTGLTVTGDQFLTDAGKLSVIKQTFPQALAVDMESAAIAQTCFLNQIKYLSLRIISDVVGKPGQVEDYQNFWQNMPEQASAMVDNVLKALP